MKALKVGVVVLSVTLMVCGCNSPQDNAETTIPAETTTELLTEKASENVPKTVNETTTESKNIETESKAGEYIDGFEVADYDKFNSYASENGLDGTYVYIEGKVLNQTKLADTEFPIISLTVEQEDGNRWSVAFVSEEKLDISEKNVRAFGMYAGYSDVVNLPVINILTEDLDKIDKVRIEALENEKWINIYTYADYLKTQPIVGKLYDGELTTRTIQDICFDIPIVFQDEVSQEGDWTYFYYEDIMLAINSRVDVDGISDSFIENSDEFVDGMLKAATDSMLIEKNNIQINTGDAIKVKMEYTIDGERYLCDSLNFMYNGYYYSFGLLRSVYTPYDYSEDFTDLTKSIRANSVLADKEEQTKQSTNENIVYEDEYIRVEYNGVEKTRYSDGSYDIIVTVENLTDQSMTVQAREMSINGYMVDPIYSCDIAAGKKSKEGMRISSDSAKDCPISDIENIETRFICYGSGFNSLEKTEPIVLYQK